MPRLGVNIDHVATVRQARRGIEPEPVFAALLAQAAGADAIVAHLREDRRHIQDRDLFLLKETLQVKFNLEMSAADEIVAIACRLQPHQATLVPEKRQELTTEGGLDVVKHFKKIKSTVGRLKGSGIEVSLFIDPQREQIRAAKKSGCSIIELHTGAYAASMDARRQKALLKGIEDAASYAHEIGLCVYAGHGLNYSNTAQVARIKPIEELNIGHAIISRAILVGIERAVREMKALVV